jgi:hypothetical protein
MYFYLCSRGFFLADPPIPEHPSKYRPYAAPGYDGNRGDSLLKDANEADDEYDDRADMLNYDR